MCIRDGSKTENEQIHKHFFKSLETENNRAESTPKYIIKNVHCIFRSSEENFDKPSNEVSNNISNKYEGIEKNTKLDGVKKLHNKSIENRNSYIIANSLNLSMSSPNHKIESIIPENRHKICNVTHDTTDANYKTACHVRFVEPLAKVHKMSLFGKEKNSTKNKNISREIEFISNNTDEPIIINSDNVGKIRVKDPKSLGIQKGNLFHLTDKEAEGIIQYKKQSVENVSIDVYKRQAKCSSSPIFSNFDSINSSKYFL